MEKTTNEDLIGREVTVCHKKFKINDTGTTSYMATGTIGGVMQDITLADTFVHDQFEGDW